ncbi:MAG: ribonuclease HI family protein [Nitrososphaerota archaeon]
MIFKLFCDGGARGNPGPAATGFVIKDSDDKIIFRQGRVIGYATNNVAEYQAVIDGLKKILEISKNQEVSEVKVYLDSQLVAKQLSGEFKIKNRQLAELFLSVKQLEKELPTISYHQILRGQNKEADFLVNKALNLNHGVEYFN